MNNLGISVIMAAVWLAVVAWVGLRLRLASRGFYERLRALWASAESADSLEALNSVQSALLSLVLSECWCERQRLAASRLEAFIARRVNQLQQDHGTERN